MVVLVVYLLIRGRIFCGWICPVNLILEIVEFLAQQVRSWMQKHNKQGSDLSPRVYFHALSRRTKIFIALGFLVLSALCGIPVFELISPVGAVFRGLILGASVGLWALFACVIFEVFFPGRLWCRKLCPLGGFYHLIGHFGFMGVKIKKGCIACDACKKVCLADPDILDPVILGTDEVVRSGDCMLCGKCFNACPKDLLKVGVFLPLRRSSASLSDATSSRQDPPNKQE